jgi:signal transduction histidine kinase
MRIRGADGNYRWFVSRAYPIRDANGRLERWVNINWDIDERKRSEQQIRDQLTQLNLMEERLSVDPILIQEVFINLISNAIEAMETNPREPQVVIKVAISDDKEMAIEVIDNGPGVDDAENIFDAFVTTKEKGMGIGLAVSRSIVEANEGQLWAENNSDFGAKFTVKLPLPKMAGGLQLVAERPPSNEQPHSFG